MKRMIAAAVLALFATSNAHAWEANVSQVLHHYSYVAVYFATDPGPLSCSYGNPYLIAIDESAASKQRIALVMSALASGMRIGGYDDGCATAIWAQSRPKIERLYVVAN